MLIWGKKRTEHVTSCPEIIGLELLQGGDATQASISYKIIFESK